jgi:hypothetical protein
MKRVLVGAVVLGWAAVVSMALAEAPAPAPARGLDEVAARSEAASYLSSTPRDAQRVADRWIISDGDETAVLDARTGALVEIEFAADLER